MLTGQELTLILSHLLNNDLATQRKKRRERELEIEQGYLVLPPRFNEPNLGYTYLVRHTFFYHKIGATIHSVHNRMIAYYYSRDDFIVAIETNYPFALERFLHRRYNRKKVEIDGREEIFDLCEVDIGYILGIKTVNGQPVKCITDIEKVP